VEEVDWHVSGMTFHGSGRGSGEQRERRTPLTNNDEESLESFGDEIAAIGRAHGK
jgi:hypothetical protein